MAKFHASTSAAVSEREVRNMERARKVASQGMVLLENAGALPLKAGTKNVALFGNGGRRTIKGGTGSGDVNSREVVNVEQGLEAAGLTVTTKDWLKRYDQVVESAKAEYFADFAKKIAEEGPAAMMYLFNCPFKEPAIIPVTAEDMDAAETDTAIYVLSRNSGEGKDRAPVRGDFELFEVEEEAIQALVSCYKNVIVVLNVGGVLDTRFLRQTKGIGAILLMSQAGNIGGYALADVLLGKVTPSGHLTTTWAEKYADYPGAMNFSHVNGDVNDEYYKEGIYVGYRYFDTFGVAPAYPFGYGKSYTDFTIECKSVTVDGNQVTIIAEVTNTGSVYSGREVVQVYYSAPQGDLEKPYQELAAYAKTKLLAPGEKQTLTIGFKVTEMASYSEAKAAYVLEPGTYYVRVGEHSRATKVAAALVLEKEVVTEKLANYLKLDVEMEMLSRTGAKPYTYEGEEAEMAAAPKRTVDAEKLPCFTAVYTPVGAGAQPEPDTSGHKITMDEVKAGTYTLDELVNQLTVEEMATLCVGTARGDFGGESVIGAASAACPGAAGDTTSLMLPDRDIRNMILADGPAGLRLATHFAADRDGNQIPGIGEAPIPGMELLTAGMPKSEIPEDATHYYQYCTAIPIATLLAQTWDVEAIEEAGDIVGEEMEELGVTLWLAPGMNIHRNPLCGRNFEYYSEDPLIAGMCAAADTLGVQKHPGVGTTIKHFAFNNQEDNRMHTNAHVSERAAREIFLKGFEVAVKRSQPMSIMTSYNLVNGIHTANSYELLTAIARQEWGFKGFVMTDWGTTGSIEMEPGKGFKYGSSNAAGCVKAGNDLTMPGSQNDVDEIVKSVGAAEGSVAYPLTLGELRAAAKHILQVVMVSAVYEGAKPYVG